MNAPAQQAGNSIPERKACFDTLLAGHRAMLDQLLKYWRASMDHADEVIPVLEKRIAEFTDDHTRQLTTEEEQKYLDLCDKLEEMKSVRITAADGIDRCNLISTGKDDPKDEMDLGREAQPLGKVQA